MKSKFFRKAIVTLLTIASVVGIFGGTQVQAASKEIRRHGTKQGVEYKAVDDWKESGCYVALRNKNKYPVHITGEVQLLNSKGKKIVRDRRGMCLVGTDIDMYLYPNQRVIIYPNVCIQSAGVNSKPYTVKNFKPVYKVKKVSESEIKKKTKTEATYYKELSNIKVSDIKDGYTDLKKKLYTNDKSFYIKGYDFDKETGIISFTLNFVKKSNYSSVSFGKPDAYGLKMYYYDKDGYPICDYVYDENGETINKGEKRYFEDKLYSNNVEIYYVDICPLSCK